MSDLISLSENNTRCRSVCVSIHESQSQKQKSPSRWMGSLRILVVEYTSTSNPAHKRLRVAAEARGHLRGWFAGWWPRGLGFLRPKRLNVSLHPPGLTAYPKRLHPHTNSHDRMIDCAVPALRYPHEHFDSRLPAPTAQPASSDARDVVCQGGHVAAAFVGD